MDIFQASASNLDTVLDIVHTTIQQVYPHYYPLGAVEFFHAHHSREAVLRDIEAGIVSLASADGKTVGTVTVHDDSIDRLFVLPEYQGNGFGSALLAFAENKVAENFGTARLDSSLPAKKIYLRHGYMVIDSDVISTENGDFLCFDTMIKRVTSGASL